MRQLLFFVIALFLMPPTFAGPREQRSIDRRTGEAIPANLTFRDESNKPVILSKYADRPTVLLFVFFRCPVACPMAIARLAHTLSQVKLKAGSDYRVVLLSFDPQDNPQSAFQTKSRYSRATDPGIFLHWKFLTGDEKSIVEVTDATGYHYIDRGNRMYSHPNVFIVLGKNGVIRSYLEGDRVSGADMQKALIAAR